MRRADILSVSNRPLPLLFSSAAAAAATDDAASIDANDDAATCKLARRNDTGAPWR